MEFTHSPLPNDLERAVAENTAYRRVLHTDRRGATQQAAMAIGYGMDCENRSIGWEQHPATSQYFAVVEGSGTLLISTTSSNRADAQRQRIGVGSKWLVTPGTWHDVEGRLRLLTIYYPIQHPRGTVDMRRRDADARERLLQSK